LSVVLNGIIVLQFVLYWNNSAAPSKKDGKPVSGGGKPAAGKASSGKGKRDKLE